MEVWSSFSCNGKTDGCLKIFHSMATERIGITNIETGFSTQPFFEHIITCGDYVLVEIDGNWGILDKGLHVVLPPNCEKLYPVKQIDTESYVSSYSTSSSSYSNLNDKDCPKHFLIQKDLGELEYSAILVLQERFHKNDRMPQDTIWEVIEKVELEPTTFFIVINKGKYFFLKIDENSCYEFRAFSKSIYQIFHYKEDVFFCIDAKGYYGYGTFTNDRIRFKMITQVQVGTNSYIHIKFVPEVVFYKDLFVAFRLPKLTKNSNESTELPISKKWVICRYESKEKKGNSSIQHSGFNYLTPFALETPLRQTSNPFLFICSFEGKSFFVEYKEDALVPLERKNGKQDCLELLSNYKKTKSVIIWWGFKATCFSGKLNASFTDYNEINCREDGLFDIYTSEGCGLVNDKQEILVPTKYDYPVKNYEPFMIVSKNGQIGLIDYKGKELLPCKYEYVQVGADAIFVWKHNSDYNWTFCETEEWDYCDNEIEEFSFDDVLQEKPILLLGINCEESKDDRQIAQCDAYLQNGEFLFSCEISPNGGVRYFNEFLSVVVFGAQKYDENGTSFYSDIKFFLLGKKQFTPYYEQACFIDKRHYLAYVEGNVGVVEISDKDNENLNWIVPCNYTFMTFPYNNLLYAVYQDGMLLRLDVFDIEDGFKMLYSLETSSNEIISNRMYCIEELLCGGVDDTITELKKRLIKKDNIVNLVCFPHYTEDVFYSGSDYCPEDNYTIEDSLRDAFDDEPEAMWGIRD